MPSIKVGRLVRCTVVKDLPGKDTYLALITGTELLAYLPKRYANRTYGQGEELTAAVFMTTEGKISLSQRSPQYFRRITEEALAEIIRAGKIRVRKAASVVNGAFAKVSIEGLGSVDPLTASLPYLDKVKTYTTDTITVVRYSANMKEYIVNSLVPAPAEKVTQVLYSQSLREAIVRVDPRYCGFFVGKGGTNVATAAKLLNVKIVIKSAEQEIAGTRERGAEHVRAQW
jgi:transcription antitermination factor NusA-like protein